MGLGWGVKKMIGVWVLALACAWVSRPVEGGGPVQDECTACELAAKMLVPDLPELPVAGLGE
ncbi:hypothetical protein BH23VER1_BH23VER1_14060 [soil metagenome]